MKTCTKCKEQKEEYAFSWKQKTKGTRQSYCLECQKILSRLGVQLNEVIQENFNMSR